MQRPGRGFGLIQGDTALIISGVFRRAAEEAGFSAPALLSYLKQQGLIETRGRAMTRAKRINGVPTECVCMRLPQDGEEPELADRDLPF